MQDIINLFQYITDNYRSYQKIMHKETEIIITFHKDFEMEIRLQGFYKIYFNNIFYYDVDSQDIKSTIDDFFTNQYAFCGLKKRVKIVKLSEYQDNPSFIHVWTTEKTLK